MKHTERGNTHMAKKQLIFCGSSETFLDKALTADSNADNGGNAFRIPSLINADGTDRRYRPRLLRGGLGLH